MAGSIAHTVAGKLVDSFQRPSFRAGVAGATVTGALCMRAGMRPAATFLVMLLAYSSAEQLWRMAEDIHETSIAQRAYLEKLAGDG